jgi:hypothetical protein
MLGGFLSQTMQVRMISALSLSINTNQNKFVFARGAKTNVYPAVLIFIFVNNLMCLKYSIK